MSQTHGGPDRGSTTGTPLWVKVLGIIVIVLVLLFVVLLLTPGGHGPRRHIPSGGLGVHILLTEHGVQQP